MSKKKDRAKSNLNTESIQLSSLTSPTHLLRATPPLVFIFVFIAYVLTLSAHLNGGDSGELTLAAAFPNGVAHPPGYPLFLILGKFFSLLPFQEPAYRINLMSAFCGAWASAIISQLIVLATRSIAAAIWGAMGFALFPLIWRYSIITEVFALNHLLCALMILAFYSVWELQKKSSIYLFALTVGLGVANHHTSIFIALPLGLSLLIFRRKEFALKIVFVSILISLFAALIPYLWLIHQSQIPSMNQWGKLTTWDGFWTHFFRREYGTFALGGLKTQYISTPSDYFAHFLNTVISHWGFLWIITFIVALFAFFRKLSWLKILTFALGLNILVMCNLSNFDLRLPLLREVTSRFWMQPWLMVCIIGAVGLSFFENRVNKKLNFTTLTLSLAASLFLLLQSWNPLHAQRESHFIEFSVETLKSLPSNAVLLSTGDHVTSNLKYAQKTMKLAEGSPILDINWLGHLWYIEKIKSVYPDFKFPDRQGFSLPELLNLNSTKRFFVANAFRAPESALEGKYELLNLSENGLIEEIVPSNETTSRVSSQSHFKEGTQNLKKWIAKLEAYPETSWERELQNFMILEKYRLAVQGLKLATEESSFIDDLPQIVQSIEEDLPKIAARNLLTPIDAVHSNLALAKQAMTRIQK